MITIGKYVFGDVIEFETLLHNNKVENRTLQSCVKDRVFIIYTNHDDVKELMDKTFKAKKELGDGQG